VGPSVRAQLLRYHAPGHVFISTELVGYLITYLFTQLILYNQTTPSRPFNAHLILQFCPRVTCILSNNSIMPFVQLRQITWPR